MRWVVSTGTTTARCMRMTMGIIRTSTITTTITGTATIMDMPTTMRTI